VSETPLRPPPHKSAYIFPNLLTAGNLFFGFYAIIAAVDDKWERAAYMIIVAAVMDGFDGKIARAMGASSRFGVEFDSLADLASFGIAPAVLVYLWALRPYQKIGWVAAFLFAACGALRLARFNVQVASTEKRWFTGMPIPMAALTVASTVLLVENFAAGGRNSLPGWVVVLLIYLLSFLMVSTVRYRSFKELETRPHKTFYFLVSAVIVLSLVAIHHQIAFFSLAMLYLASGLLEPPIALLLGRRRQRPGLGARSEEPRRPPSNRENREQHP
jgi:CDP-diacylglycerol--serine O-phosphatidyltransferase